LTGIKAKDMKGSQAELARDYIFYAINLDWRTARWSSSRRATTAYPCIWYPMTETNPFA